MQIEDYQVYYITLYLCDTDLRMRFAWQGLADVDPDVDALYRLTQPLNIVFDANSPSVVLPEGIMAPLNSQNTIYASEALWSLILPVTTTSRQASMPVAPYNWHWPSVCLLFQYWRYVHSSIITDLILSLCLLTRHVMCLNLLMFSCMNRYKHAWAHIHPITSAASETYFEKLRLGWRTCQLHYRIVFLQFSQGHELRHQQPDWVPTRAPEEVCRETPSNYGVFDRIADIWRGYWAQRLLWEIGGHVAFGPPSVNRVRCETLLECDVGRS